MRRRRDESESVFVIGSERMLDEADLVLEVEEGADSAAAEDERRTASSVATIAVVGEADPLAEESQATEPSVIRAPRARSARPGRVAPARLLAIGAIVAVVLLVTNALSGGGEDPESEAEQLASNPAAEPQRSSPLRHVERRERSSRREDQPETDHGASRAPRLQAKGRVDAAQSRPRATAPVSAAPIAASSAPVDTVPPLVPTPAPATQPEATESAPAVAASAAEVRQEFGPR